MTPSQIASPVLKAPADVVRAYWQAMATNDFTDAALWLDENVRIYWPQSSEVIEGRADFAAVNQAYPCQGLWRFDVVRLIAQGDEVVTETIVRDDRMTARAITFHRVTDGQIVEQIEYWPDDYPAPDWRAGWVRHGQLPRPEASG